MKKQKTFKDIAFYAIILILVFVMIYSGLRILESTVFHQDQTDVTQAPTKTIERDGVQYFPRQDITVVLLVGIDQEGTAQSSNSYNNPGAADMVSLLIFDEKHSTATVLCLNRDTMMDIPVLGIGGKPAGSRFGQLALAHTYGSGLQDSCENTRKAVSQFLYGLNIDYYLSVRMDAIALANDAVGGVTVNVTDDFSEADPTIGIGQVTLMGDQALSFVRSRKGVGNQLNISRIERQKAYMEGFLLALREKMDVSGSFMLELYEDIADYVVTDCSATSLNNLAKRYTDYAVTGILYPEGENVQGEEYYEFYADEEKLDQLILELFYAPKA